MFALILEKNITSHTALSGLVTIIPRAPPCPPPHHTLQSPWIQIGQAVALDLGNKTASSCPLCRCVVANSEGNTPKHVNMMTIVKKKLNYSDDTHAAAQWLRQLYVEFMAGISTSGNSTARILLRASWATLRKGASRENDDVRTYSRILW